MLLRNKLKHDVCNVRRSVRAPSVLSLVLLMVLFTNFTNQVFAQGPGIGNLNYNANEVFTSISSVSGPKGYGSAAMVDGYLMTIFANDGLGTSGEGGIDFWDVSDPRNPVLFARHNNADTNELREAHGFGLSSSYPGDYLVAQAGDGIQFWDVSDAANIQLISYMDLPGIVYGDYTGAWWVFWQAPYVYVAGVDQGLYVVDATNPGNPQLLNHMRTNQLGGINPGQVYAIGNLLIIATHTNNRFASFDISDPANPVLLDTYTGNKGYSHLFAAGTILTSGGNGDIPKLYAHRINHNGQFSYLGEVGPSTLGLGGYGSYQDGFFHSGFSDQYAKFQVFNQAGEIDLQYVNSGSANVANADEDFGNVLGNLIFAGNDHDGSSGIIVHQQAADLKGPDVHWVHPANGAENQLTSTRIGVSMSDLIDIESVTANSFTVRPIGGQPISGKYSTQLGIVNFSPDQPLLLNTTYEVVINGIQDVMGNTGEVFNSIFNTGSTLPLPPTCTINALPALETNTIGYFSATITSGSPLISSVIDFGNGSIDNDYRSNSVVNIAYGTADRFNIVLTVENVHGSSSCSAVQIVHNPVTANKASRSSSIVQNADFVFNVNPDNNTVSAIDKTSLQKAWETTVGINPTTLSLGPNNELWIVNQDSDSISIVNAENGALIRSIQLSIGSAPHSIAFAPDKQSVYVSLMDSGRLLKLDAQGNIVGNLEIGEKPKAIAISSDSQRVFLTRFISNSRDLDNLDYLPEGEIWEINANTVELTRTLPLAFDPGPDTELSGRGVPNYLNSISISPDGKRALVASKKDNVARGLFYDGQELTFESRVRAIVSTLDLDNNSELLDQRIDLNDRNMPSSVSFSPLGDLFFTTLLGNDVVEVRDSSSPSSMLATVQVGKAPNGLLIDGVNQQLYVHNFLSRSVTVVDISALLSATGNNSEVLAEISTVEQEQLTASELNGKRLFYNAADPRLSRDGYISCASCHLDDGQDGQIWDFTQAGEGLRNTISLAGIGNAMKAGFHWTLNFDEIQDFENEIRNSFGGTGLLSNGDFLVTEEPLGPPKEGLSSDLDDLTNYINSLTEFSVSPYREVEENQTNFAPTGKTLFYASGCDDCHSGELFTDGLKHDVGTVTSSSGLGLGIPLENIGIRTPTLKGVWKTAPYLHNGQAATLMDVLQNTTHVGALDLTEKQAIVAYLKQIDDLEFPELDTYGPAFGELVDVIVEVEAQQVAVSLDPPLVTDESGVDSLSHDGPNIFPIGATAVTWTAIDTLGNESTAIQNVIVEYVDSTPPEFATLNDLIVEAQSNLTSIELARPEVSDSSGINSISNDAPDTYSLGTTVVTWTAVDQAGNVATATQTIIVQDTIAPQINLEAVLLFKATGLETSLEIPLPTVTDASDIQSITNNSNNLFSLGDTEILWTAIDISGNISEKSQIIRVSDVVYPIIPELSNKIVEATGVLTQVELDPPSASDNIGVKLITHDAPEEFSLGSTTITWTVVDQVDNVTTAEQIINVQDTIAPQINLEPLLTIEATGVLTEVELILPTISDSVGLKSITNNAPEKFDLGLTDVTWTATDFSGNSSTATQQVSIVDTSPPQIINVIDLTIENEETAEAVIQQMSEVAAVDNIQIEELTNDAPETFPVGVTVVTWTASDAAGNKAELEQEITVVTKLQSSTSDEDSTTSEDTNAVTESSENTNKDSKSSLASVDPVLLLCLIGLMISLRLYRVR